MKTDPYSYHDILKRRAEGHDLPLAGQNAMGENIILSEGHDESGRHFYSIETAQSNGWCLLTSYYEDGSVDEIFKKSNS